MKVKALDRLPSLVLEVICDLLVGHDVDEDLTALCAFALASKACLAAATAQRFHQIILLVSATDRPADFATPSGFRQQFDINGWIKLLDKYDGWRHIRRLRVTHGPEDLTSHEYVAREWDHQHDLDVDNFVRPWRTGNELRNFELLDHAHFVNLLPAFLLRATGLRDLVWVPSQIPPYIVELLATQIPRCRLHMHRFYLRSLWMPREKAPQPISDQDWALLTSPSLCTIVAAHLRFDGKGNVSYLEPAMMRMIGGAAPNLQHLSLRRMRPKASPGLQAAARLGRPQWAGFHPNSASASAARREDDQVIQNREDTSRMAEGSGRGALSSLVLRQGVTGEDMIRYGELTDLTKLSHLTLKGMGNWGLPLATLARLARAGEFRSLTSLCLQATDSTGSGLSALNDILDNVGKLQHLCLGGFVGNESFDVILRRHGETLRSLHLDPYGDFQGNDLHKPSELLQMSASDVQRIAESCRHLTEAEIPVSRCRGNTREIAVYRALSRLRHLKRAWLNLYYWVGPDENASDDITEEDMYQGWDGDDVTLAHLKDAIVDCAIDETLARSIFDIISRGTGASHTGTDMRTSHSNFRWLRLDIHRRRGRFGTPGAGSSYFAGLMQLFTREWVVERRHRSHYGASQATSSPRDAASIRVTELHPEQARQAADQEWKFHEEWEYDSRQKFRTAFEELWQPDTNKPEWYNDWRSFPLQVSSDSMDRKDVLGGV